MNIISKFDIGDVIYTCEDSYFQINPSVVSEITYKSGQVYYKVDKKINLVAEPEAMTLIEIQQHLEDKALRQYQGIMSSIDNQVNNMFKEAV